MKNNVAYQNILFTKNSRNIHKVIGMNHLSTKYNGLNVFIYHLILDTLESPSTDKHQLLTHFLPNNVDINTFLFQNLCK